MEDTFGQTPVDYLECIAPNADSEMQWLCLQLHSQLTLVQTNMWLQHAHADNEDKTRSYKTNFYRCVQVETNISVQKLQ